MTVDQRPPENRPQPAAFRNRAEPTAEPLTGGDNARDEADLPIPQIPRASWPRIFPGL